MSTDVLVKLFPARARRRFQRGLKRNCSRNCVKLYILSMMSTRFFGGLEQKMEVPDGEKPLRTHLRNMIILH